MSSSSIAALSAITSFHLTHALPLAFIGEKESLQAYVKGPDWNSCPENYYPVKNQAECEAALKVLQGSGDSDMVKDSVLFGAASTADPGGCFTFQHGAFNTIYFNTNVDNQATSGHQSPRQLVCGLNQFSGFEGKWVYKGTGLVGVTQETSISWEVTQTQSMSTSFEVGLEAGAEAEFMGIGASVSVSTTWGISTETAIEKSQGGSETSSCGSRDCSEGNLYQWVIEGTVRPEFGSGTQSVATCNFVCIPSNIGGDKTPQCPPKFCLDTNGCQCCNSNEWMEQPSEPTGSDVCPSSSNALPQDNDEVCNGCDA